jgi:rhamnosyltransferase
MTTDPEGASGDTVDAVQAVTVAAVVTAFNAGDALVELCAELRRQVDTVVVVDDGSTVDPSPLLARCAALGCRVVSQPRNTGIAAALNAGVTAAGHFDWLLTFDQDSRVAAGYVRQLVETAEAATVAGIGVAMVAPGSIEGLKSRTSGHRSGFTLGGEPIQSGLLFPRAAIDSLGPFSETLFIDSVDTEYYLRAKTRGFVVVVAPAATLEHSLGERYYPRMLGGRLGLVVSAPFRYYYIARNHVAMLKLYGRRAPGWAFRETLLDARHIVVVLVLVSGRRRRLQMLVAGWRDGFRGVGGRIPAALG